MHPEGNKGQTGHARASRTTRNPSPRRRNASGKSRHARGREGLGQVPSQTSSGTGFPSIFHALSTTFAQAAPSYNCASVGNNSMPLLSSPFWGRQQALAQIAPQSLCSGVKASSSVRARIKAEDTTKPRPFQQYNYKEKSVRPQTPYGLQIAIIRLSSVQNANKLWSKPRYIV